ncbi:MAG TPA: electron transfer flavoprotein subunit beta/FixA family protein [Chloroflexota bacterium]|nr:electron transfer flavoprotein subunit beta/FixA family protein [Chloroflexota bacterium]
MTLDILVCVKRVPATGGKITLTPDERHIDTRYASFTMSPHEECGVEEALRLVEKHGGTTTVLTLGPAVAADQLRDAMAMGVQRAILLQTGENEWDPGETARAIVTEIERQRAAGHDFDLVLVGNEAADSGDYQVGIRVAHALGRPAVNGVKSLEITGSTAVVKREAAGGWEIFEIDLPAVIGVKEGINLPRYPTVPGRLRAKKAPIETRMLSEPADGLASLRMRRLKLPPAKGEKGETLGRGVEAVPALVEVLRRLEIVTP